MNSSPLLVAKAEVVFGTLLVARNGAVRLVSALVLILGGVLSVQEAERFSSAHRPMTAFLVVGTLAALAGARLFAPGAAVAAFRQVAAPWWVVPLGRLTGGLLVVLPVAAIPLFAIELASVDTLPLYLSAALYGAAVASFSFSFAPVTGSSASGALTLATVWIGAIPVSALHGLLEQGPVVRHPLLLLWSILPLPWRAERVLTVRDPIDALVLLAWIGVAVLAAGCAATAASRIRGRRRDHG